eukprot:CAMPEP_0117563670 /NCGR_PEP_ID=MMETSP0784-20121206/55618_1 /TAXON_ID=39447 /ORGANISM="" /LENGTH=687 /DNA_ID=CAMNT_0005361331 /DNA_START=43 /DNA_END=2104 /DNA_ORIENTATION=+
MALGNKNSETQASNDAAEPESTSDAGESSSSGNQSSDSIMDPSSSSQIVEGNEEVQLICVGLMRTGLKTLRRALSELGYTRFYDEEDIVSTYELWDGVLRNREKDTDFSDIFRGAQVVMGMPTYCFWEQILERYPNARVILTVRHEDGWWESVSRAKALGSAMRRFEKFLVPSYHKFCEILRFAWATTLGAHALESSELNEVSTRSSYRRHNSYVKSALAKQRTASGQRRLLVYNVCEGWAPLCKFLHKAAPEEHFPAVMTVPYFLRDAKQHGFERQTSEGGGQEFEEFMVPDSDFGVCMRKELRRGLAVVLSGLAFLAAVVLVVHQTSLVEVPVAFVAFIYLAVMTAAWQAYVVMHGLVMRVPTLVVLPMALKSFLIASCLQGCFITYGILKEMIVTQDRIASPVLILSARLMSVVCGAVASLVIEGRISFGGAPLYSFSAFGFTNEASTWAGYEMLKYVSFPVQVMAKSCKLLPNMIMGKVLNGTQYKLSQYFQAVGAMVCVTIMHLSDENSHQKEESSGVDEDNTGKGMRMLLGVGLLIMFFACDSFTSQWQTALYKKHPKISQIQMMLAGNLVGVFITMVSVLARWTALRKSLAHAAANPEVIGRILLLGLSGAMGQFCIYSAIKVLGPLSFTWIMTSRQLLSVLISLVMFGHGVSPVKLLCIVTVFAIMSSKQLSRAVRPAM